ncbi:uncharacterized protein BJX67DRAFT_155091 [Aspergillus lucknowensis]|uniref:Secreted protein n=1 Tax=Aspergillus lucknowensis TaxID=176173 RepID=A0ABR4LQW5_9EURO
MRDFRRLESFCVFTFFFFFLKPSGFWRRFSIVRIQAARVEQAVGTEPPQGGLEDGLEGGINTNQTVGARADRAVIDINKPNGPR